MLKVAPEADTSLSKEHKNGTTMMQTTFFLLSHFIQVQLGATLQQR